MPHTPILSAEALNRFEALGFVHVREAFPTEAALRMQAYMWASLEARHGVKQDDRSTWSLTNYELNRTATDPVYADIAAPRLCTAIDQLLGPGTWDVPKSWGGFLVTFPERDPDQWRLEGKGWHWDGDALAHLNGLQALAIFMLFSEIRPHGGGTLLVAGSHKLVNRWFIERPDTASLKRRAIHKLWYGQYPWLDELANGDPHAAGREARFTTPTQVDDDLSFHVVEITGDPGDVYLCHPSIFHSPSYNAADRPRFMRIKGLTVRTYAGP